jgi:hypothetical protein
MSNDEQERELEKVNAFYLQKEAEVCSYHLSSLLTPEQTQLTHSSSKSDSRLY